MIGTFGLVVPKGAGRLVSKPMSDTCLPANNGTGADHPASCSRHGGGVRGSGGGTGSAALSPSARESRGPSCTRLAQCQDLLIQGLARLLRPPSATAIEAPENFRTSRLQWARGVGVWA